MASWANRVGWMALAGASLVVSDLVSVKAGDHESRFTLALSGNSAARVEVSCAVRQLSGTETTNFSSMLPIRRAFEGQSLTCRIHQTAVSGRVDVLLSSTTGNVSRLSIAGAGSRIHIAVR